MADEAATAAQHSLTIATASVAITIAAVIPATLAE